jgi:hypothetical protein
MHGLAYLRLASQQRGDTPTVPAPLDIYNGDRLRYWCAACGDHMVRQDGDECPCCEPLCSCAVCRARREVPR